jgi:hypothetical protein
MSNMEHTDHHWRATSKVFALLCECGVVYHDWLQVEIEKLRAAAAAGAAPAPTGPSEETITLRAQLEEARREAATLRTQLAEARAVIDEATRELEVQAAVVTDAVTHG